MQFVVDASVAVKWIFPAEEREPDVSKALAVLQEIQSAEVQILQLPHWLAEVSAVVSHVAPESVREAVGVLYAMEIPVSDSLEIYNRACELAVQLGYHVFDTLYHAVALCSAETLLLMADERYYRKAKPTGCISLLAEFRSSLSPRGLTGRTLPQSSY